MNSVDYSNYLEQQNQWASSLRRLAREGEPERARELGELAAATLRRMLRFSFQAPDTSRDLREPD